MAIYDYKCEQINQGIRLTALEFVDRGRRIQRGTMTFLGVSLPAIEGDIENEIDSNPSLE